MPSSRPAAASVKAAIERDGASFVRNVISQPCFRDSGVSYGSSAHCCWAVVDIGVHPLYVWRKSGRRIDAYSRSGRHLDAAVFTNGPMMGKRLGGRRKLTRRWAASELMRWTSGGAVGGFLLGRESRSRLGAALGGAALGTLHAWRRIFTSWSACGDVLSRRNGIVDRRNFDFEGETHAWFGRFSTEFGSYAVGDGQLPDGVSEGLGGLIRIVRAFEPAGMTRCDSDFAALSAKKGVAAWGLVPLACRSGERDGILVVLASRRLDAAAAAALLCSIGTREAVATDQSGSVMMGARQEFMVGPPPIHRQAMQTYGLCCR